MVLDHDGEHALRWAAVQSIAGQIGCSAHTLLDWVKKADRDSGRAPGAPSEVAAKLKALERENRELQIERVFAEKFSVYCVRKVWRQLRREGVKTACCTVVRLMGSMGLQGVIRSKPIKATVSDKAAACPLDHVYRQFTAERPNALWVSDFTYVSTWGGLIYVAFVIDAFARRVVGWRACRTSHASFVLDALEQALHDRRPVRRGGWCIIRIVDRNTCRSNIPSA
jgi:transposase InsO family protein